MVRKLLLCSLEQNKLEQATEVFHSMGKSTKEEPATRYLAFKLALKIGDHDLASECLENLGHKSSSDPRYLYACCLDARNAGNRICAIKSLEQLAMKHEFSPSGPIHFPALLRTLIRLQMPALSGEDDVDSLCRTFESGNSPPVESIY